jgi:hypothetical protein
MSTNKTTSLNTHELSRGMIVHCHGGRFLIDQDIKVSRSHPVVEHRGVCRYTSALYLGNVEGYELDPMVAVWVKQDGGRWSIQGNRLATWTVEYR